MTKQQSIKCACWDCSTKGNPVDLVCPKCKQSFSVGTPFSYWLRSYPILDSRKYKFDNQNLDYVWFSYNEGWLILLEEKIFSSSQSVAQRDTHNIVDQMLAIASGNKVTTMRGEREIEYRGYYVIRFENTNLNDSKWIHINGKKHSQLDLLHLLYYGELINVDISKIKHTSHNQIVFLKKLLKLESPDQAKRIIDLLHYAFLSQLQNVLGVLVKQYKKEQEYNANV